MPAGRPTTYSPVILPAVQAAASFGATRDEVADYLGITTRCLYKWQVEFPELVQALKRGEERSADRVVETLYQLALGWKGGKPDLGAICFYLKNKRPAEWRDVQHLDQAVGHYIISDRPMTEDQWIAERTKREPKVIEASPMVPQGEAERQEPSSSNGLADTD